jgi:surface polysaccharide O-acyltransferase-like enzyme
MPGLRFDHVRGGRDDPKPKEDSMIFDADVNYLAVILGALATQPLGFLWYSNFFGSRWMQARGYTMADIQGGGGMGYLVSFLGALLIAYTLARLVDMVSADSVLDCIAVAAFVWVGFTATVQASQIAFSPHATSPMAVFAIEGGFYLVSFVMIGAIIGAFQ